MQGPRRGRSSVVAGMLALLACVLVAGCGGGGGGGKTNAAGTDTGAGKSDKRELTIGVPTPPISLDPAKDGSGPSTLFHDLANEPIVHMKPDGSLEGGLAASYRYIGSGNKVFELTIKPDMKFSDGTPVTATAVKSWLEYFENAHGPFSKLIDIESITTRGASTLRLHLASPNPIVPLLLSENYNWGFVSSPKVLAKAKVLGTRTFGAGPYVLDHSQTVQGDHYTFVPNKHYPDKSAIKFTKVTIKSIGNAQTRLEATKTGQVDVSGGDLATAKAAEAAGLELIKAPATFDGLILLDRAGKIAKPLGDVRVRQALNYAIDRDTITRGLFGQFATPISHVPMTDVDDAGEDYYPYDPAKAKALLAQAGYPKGFKLKVLVTGYSGQYGTPFVQAMASYYSKVGVELESTPTQNFGDVAQKLASGQFPVLQLNTQANPAWIWYGLALQPKSTLNPLGANDPVMGKLFKQGQEVSDPAPYWRQLSQRVTSQAWFVPVSATNIFFYANKNVGGVAFNARSVEPNPTTWFPK